MSKTKHPAKKRAEETGEPYFFTGVPCKRGHISKRETRTGVCVKCHQHYVQKRKLEKKFTTISVKEFNKIVDYERMDRFIREYVNDKYGISLEKTDKGVLVIPNDKVEVVVFKNK